MLPQPHKGSILVFWRIEKPNHRIAVARLIYFWIPKTVIAGIKRRRIEPQPILLLFNDRSGILPQTFDEVLDVLKAELHVLVGCVGVPALMKGHKEGREMAGGNIFGGKLVLRKSCDVFRYYIVFRHHFSAFG
jgi:hypothetical protein